ncbi:ABC transporter G family member 23-like [Achroia grisella]|uniref:ABC transporter G family member 23-like n=1 Tax=Achroia grisella TaxID=688607 RepID=UPI0027D2740E|nr:ABC transporter G family member 23-like [Achroia grisella]
MAARNAAVVIERACKYYGSPDKPDYKPVLIDMNMTVERGIIYGLLGPSGCGKTTLLSCIVGRRKLNSGNVWVLGGKPGERGSGVPGPRVGYMPQDIALVGEFSVRDAVYYFGRIYGMKDDRLRERFAFLSELLDLADEGRLIKSLSGGQQRRVSLAAALVHEPELLILDEPTVGLDPMLRERIWEFLSELARRGTTVIITTHYIDETKQAHKIGLLRDGQLLAEEAPEQLLRKFDCDTLEDAFLKLALRQHNLPPRRQSSLSVSPDVIPESSIPGSQYSSRETFNVVTSSTDVLTKNEKPKDCNSKSKARYKAVFIKSIQQFTRHPGGLIFSVIFPILQVVAFFSAVGHDPRDLKIPLINEEAASSPYGLDICKNNSLQPITRLEDDICEFDMISCWFLDEVQKKLLHPLPYNSTEEAKNSVLRAKYHGAMHIGRNFSEALATRLRDGDVGDNIVDDSNIEVWIDTSNFQISNFIKTQLMKAYKDFMKRAMIACDKNEGMAQLPVNFHDPVYGDKDAQFQNFMAPGVMITIIFFLAAVVTSTLMISDRLEGVWERSAVAGVKPKEMLNVHIVLQSAVILMQTIEMMLLAFVGYGLDSKGSLLTVGILLFLQGLSGMCYGFLLSIYCGSFTMAFFVATGSFYPMILLCGILWPLEGMSMGLRYVALTLPFTIPSKSLRDIMEKGYTIADPTVYYGFLVTVAWIVISLLLCLLRLKYKKM